MNERWVKFTIHYDGAGFHGWQVQPEVRTVQAEFERVLSRLTNRPTTVIAAGRTDTGVHAMGQVASTAVPAKWRPAALRRSLNALLPPDIWVADAEEVEPGFHARYDAIARSYLYRVGTVEEARSPFRRRWCWPLGEPLDMESMARATEAIVGEHSFKAFAKAGQEERGDRCTIMSARWRPWEEIGVEFHVTANRFLHHMVRYLVGTLVDIGRGRRPLEDMAALLEGGTELGTSPPAPPEGLFLTHVAYPREAREDEERTDEDLP